MRNILFINDYNDGNLGNEAFRLHTFFLFK